MGGAAALSRAGSGGVSTARRELAGRLIVERFVIIATLLARIDRSRDR